MMKKKHLLGLSTLLLTCTLTASAYAAEEIKVFVGDKALIFDQPPIVEEGRTLVPMRTIFEALEAKVSWDQETQTVTAISADGKEIALQIGQPEAVITESDQVSKKALDVPAQIVGGRTLVPLRAVSELMAAEVKWDEQARTVTIAKPIKTETGHQVFTGKDGITVSASREWAQAVGGSSMEENDAIVLMRVREGDAYGSEVTFIIKADSLDTYEKTLQEMRSKYDVLPAEQKESVLAYYMNEYPPSEQAAIKELFTAEDVDYTAVSQALTDYDFLERLRSGGVEAALVKKEMVTFLSQPAELSEIEAVIEGTTARYYVTHTVKNNVNYTLLVSGEKEAIQAHAAEIKEMIVSANIMQ